MDTSAIVKQAKNFVREYVIDHSPIDVMDMGTMLNFDVYIVWQCKTLQNWKALLSTDLVDGMYYEVTYNGDKDEFYFDAYRKEENIVVKSVKLSATK